MKNFKKMILIDLDGTLLNSRSTISKKNQAMLRKLIKLNYAVFIATGRNYKEALELTSNIEGLAYITTNGSYIVDFEGNVIFNNSIDQSLLAPLIKNLEKYNGLSYYLSSADKIFAKNKYKILKNLLLIDGIKELFSVDSIFRLINNYKLFSISVKKDMEKFVGQKELIIQKLYVMGNENKLKKAYSELSDKFKGKVKITTSGNFNLEINAAATSKGTALKFLSQRFKTSLENTIAFGDGNNDLELLELAGTSVAMANTNSNDLKARADLIAPNNNEDGVAKVLCRLFSEELP